MADAYHHSLSSVKKWGGEIEDYYNIHNWFDTSKHHFGDFRHRALKHHTEGIVQCIQEYGITVELSNKRVIPVRWVAEQHIIEDLGFLPTIADWFKEIEPAEWMNKSRSLSRELRA